METKRAEGSEAKTLKYTFTVTQKIEAHVQEGERADKRALEEARRATGQYTCWDDVAKMEIEKAA